MRVEINNTTEKEINLAQIKKVAEKFLSQHGKNKYGVSIAFVDNKEIQKLNKAYRQIDKPTDVLSFAGEGDFLGEIVISYEQVVKQAEELKENLNDELVYILVHGLLHLLGYNDEKEEESLEMKKLADKFISRLQIYKS